MIEARSTNSILQFKGYEVKKIYFETEESQKGLSYDICPQFMRKIEPIGDNSYKVTLGCKIESTKEEPFPFNLEVILDGFFYIEELNRDNEILLKENSLAILFPYLRNIISTITLNANVSPLILPTMNIVEFFKNDDN